MSCEKHKANLKQYLPENVLPRCSTVDTISYSAKFPASIKGNLILSANLTRRSCFNGAILPAYGLAGLPLDVEGCLVHVCLSRANFAHRGLSTKWPRFIMTASLGSASIFDVILLTGAPQASHWLCSFHKKDSSTRVAMVSSLFRGWPGKGTSNVPFGIKGVERVHPSSSHRLQFSLLIFSTEVGCMNEKNRQPCK